MKTTRVGSEPYHSPGVTRVIEGAPPSRYSGGQGGSVMDDRNALTLASALGEAAFKAALRAIAMLLITFIALAVLAGAAFVSSAIEAAQPEPAQPAENILLMPARDPGTSM